MKINVKSKSFGKFMEIVWNERTQLRRWKISILSNPLLYCVCVCVPWSCARMSFIAVGESSECQEIWFLLAESTFPRSFSAALNRNERAQHTTVAKSMDILLFFRTLNKSTTICVAFTFVYVGNNKNRQIHTTLSTEYHTHTHILFFYAIDEGCRRWLVLGGWVRKRLL